MADVLKQIKTLFDWTFEAQERGAGEILFTSMNHDGVKAGYANEALAELSVRLSIPIIASGGAGTMDAFSRYIYRRKGRCCVGSQCFSLRRDSDSRFKIVSLRTRNPGKALSVLSIVIRKLVIRNLIK